ncbi:MAG TPA: hypothetical protein PK395_19250, partial [bacterium]|nr:hypothetical protein [bacterium]
MGFMGMLPENAVVISGDDRYRFFMERLDTEYGKVDETRLMEMIKRPVSMKSNLHCAIFHPATAEAWVAHAGSDGAPACDQTYHHYVLGPTSAN